MNWYLWFLVGWFFTSAVVAVSRVGKAEKPTTPGVAAGVVVIDALLVASVFVFGAH